MSVSCSSRPPALPQPAGEVDVKFEQLCWAEVNLPAALGGRCGTEEEAERRKDREHEAVSHFFRFVSLTFVTSQQQRKDPLYVLASASLFGPAQR